MQVLKHFDYFFTSIFAVEITLKVLQMVSHAREEKVTKNHNEFMLPCYVKLTDMCRSLLMGLSGTKAHSAAVPSIYLTCSLSLLRYCHSLSRKFYSYILTIFIAAKHCYYCTVFKQLAKLTFVVSKLFCWVASLSVL